jgi:uncharacterized protein YchJ
MLYKTQRLGELFAPTCVLEVDRYGLAGTYTPGEVSSQAARARPRLARLVLSFHDLQVRFPTKDTAEAEFTARVVAQWDSGGAVEDTAEVRSELRRIEGKWLFCRFSEVTVLQR